MEGKEGLLGQQLSTGYNTGRTKSWTNSTTEYCKAGHVRAFLVFIDLLSI